MSIEPDKPPVLSSTAPDQLPTVTGSSFSSGVAVIPGASEGLSPSVPASDPQALATFGTFAHSQVREYIQLADSKAGFLFAAASALLAFLYQAGATTYWLCPFSAWSLISVVSLVAMSGLAAAALLAVLTVFPRTPGHSNGLLFWSAIASRPSATTYATEVQECNEATLAAAYLTHTHELATVCKGKYVTLRRAFIAGLCGFAASLIFLFFDRAA